MAGQSVCAPAQGAALSAPSPGGLAIGLDAPRKVAERAAPIFQNCKERIFLQLVRRGSNVDFIA
jgi:hypothetical protein